MNLTQLHSVKAECPPEKGEKDPPGPNHQWFTVLSKIKKPGGPTSASKSDHCLKIYICLLKLEYIFKEKIWKFLVMENPPTLWERG